MHAQSTTAEFLSKISHKAIFDYTLAHGETLSNSSASCGEGPGDQQTTQSEGQILFRMRRRIAPLIQRKAAANASPDTNPTNRASTSLPPIRTLYPAQHQP